MQDSVLGIETTLDGRTLVMGIVNVTEDSFSDGGKYLEIDKAIAHAHDLVAQGADIVDIGGESTRPGATEARMVSTDVLMPSCANASITGTTRADRKSVV